MNKIHLVIFLFIISLFSSCSDSSNPSGPVSGVFTINENIENYPVGSVFDYTIVGPVSTSYPMGVPLFNGVIGPESKLKLTMGDLSPSQLVPVSATQLTTDTITKAASWYGINLYRNDSVKGYLVKSNIIPGSSAYPETGNFYEYYIYIEASKRYTGTNISIVAGDTFKTVIDCNLNQGWNRLASVYTAVRPQYWEMTATNNIPPGGKWYFVPLLMFDRFGKFPFLMKQ